MVNEIRETMINPKISIVIPVFNEGKTIGIVMDRVLSVPYLSEIVIVDDCSVDETVYIVDKFVAENSGLVRLIRHETNLGKTAALRAGFRASSGDIVIVQDADLEYDSSEIANLVQPIIDCVADVVYGSRFLVRKATRVSYLNHFLANKFLTFVSNLFTNFNLTDVETGYKAFRGDIIRNMIISSKGFGFEIEVTAKIAKLGCALCEVPISYYARTYEQGKKLGIRDGFAAFWYIFRYNLLCSLKNSYQSIPSEDLVMIRAKHSV